MSVTSMETVFRNQMAAYAACDVDALVKSFTEDCVLVDMAEPDKPYVGVDAVREFLVDYFASLQDVVVEVTRVTGGEDTVIGELDVTASYIGEPFSKANGRSIRLRYCVAEEIRDGHVARERFYWDSA